MFNLPLDASSVHWSPLDHVPILLITWHRVLAEQDLYLHTVNALLVLSQPRYWKLFTALKHNCTVYRQKLETYCLSLCNTLKVSAELTLPLARLGSAKIG